MKTAVVRDCYTGIIRMGNAIRSKDVYSNGARVVYHIEDKPMKQIWKQKIDEIQEIIDNTPVVKDGRIKQLYRKKEFLQMAFGRV